MAELIEMPKLSDTMSVGTVVSWLKKEGDPVASGDMIAEIETDKATMEMEVFTDGILLKQYVKAGGQVAVGEPIAAIGKKGETAPKVDSAESAAVPAESKAEKQAEVSKEPESEPTPIPVTGPGSMKPQMDQSDERTKASPLAKKLAKEKGVDLSLISGTGPGGRIVKADVYEAIETGIVKKPASTESPTPAVPMQKVAAIGPGIGESISIPVSNMRAVIASRLLESKTQIPHFYLDIEVDMGPLLALRKSINSITGASPEKGGIKYSVNDFMLKAATEALRRVPKANASWQGKTIEQYGEVHMAFAVAVEEGLVTPTIKNAHNKSLTQISLEAKELIVKAQSKKLKPDEMSGSTFTISNLGMYGINSFYGIINPPNAAILSIGATVRKPVVAEDGSIVPGDRMHIGLSGDHRVVDGAVGAAYLAALKELIENPALMLL